jgi:hypothetical protein
MIISDNHDLAAGASRQMTLSRVEEMKKNNKGKEEKP